MCANWIGSFLLALLIVAGGPRVSQADLIISNLDPTPFAFGGSGVSDSAGYTWLATAFTMGATSFDLQSVDLLLEGGNSYAGIGVALYTDNGSGTGLGTWQVDFDSSPISTLAAGEVNIRTLNPTASYTLQSDTAYWLKLYTTGQGGDITWRGAYPSGVALIATGPFATAPTNSALVQDGTILQSGTLKPFGYQVNGLSAVPEPCSLALLGMAGGLIAFRFRSRSRG